MPLPIPPTDPLSIGLSFLDTKGGAALLGGLTGGGGAPAGPSNAVAGAYGSGLDGSGWAVNFAGVQSTASNQDKSGGVPGFGVSGVGGAIPWYVYAALAAAVLWKVRRSAK